MPKLASGELTYAGDGLVEWWRPVHGGVEQGWRLDSSPGGAGELVLEVGVVGATAATTGEGAVVLSGPRPTERWVVSGLRAWDADGRLLPGRFEAESDGFLLHVDDSGARYPVEIDPLYRYEDVYLDTSALGFGTAMDGGGDVNGDGFADVIIASEGDVDGRAWVYLGSPEGGLPLQVTLSGLDMAEPGRASVAFADVNGDGYSDVVAGADAYDEAVVFLGPDLALTTRLQSTCRSPFGYVVANAGDTNADGFDDVLVGSPESDDPDYGSGCVAVYLGSSGGLSGSPDLELRGEESRHDQRFGNVVAGLGDVNGDGLDEIGIGSTVSGYTYVYEGSAGGPSAVLSTAYLNSTFALDAAGDVNADGFADVVASATHGVQVIFGSAAGLASSIGLPLANDAAGAGDVNGDGYDDVIIGVSQRAYVFHGLPDGIQTTASQTLSCEASPGEVVASAGDVDRDGLGDVLAGGWGVCLFLGSTLAGPGETGVVDSPDPAPHYPGTSPDTSDSDDAAGWMNEDDTEGQPTHPGKSGCAGGGCGGGSVSAVVVLLSLSGVRRRRE